MSKITPAVVLKSKFNMPHSKKFKSYIQYIERDEARINLEQQSLENEFQYYMNYMGDAEKNGELFTEDKDFLSEDEKKVLVELFTSAEEKGSPMWQDVVSFDNQFLIDEKLYNSKTGYLDESRMKLIIRDAMETLIEKENMKSPLWTASFHYNTDNIHAHIASVEMEPQHLEKIVVVDEETGIASEEYRGKRKQSSLNQMKSKVVNKIVDRTPAFKEIDTLIKNQTRVIKEQRMSQLDLTKDLFVQAMELLPDDTRQWKYGYQSINDARPMIDEITEMYLETYHKEEYEELVNILDEQTDLSKRLYGEESNASDYKKNKLDGLKSKLGNAVLTEMRMIKKELDKQEHSSSQNTVKKRSSVSSYGSLPSQHMQSRQLGKAVFQLNQAMRKSYHEHQKDKNIAEFDRMLEGYDYE